MKQLNIYPYEIKKSKFIAYYYEVTTREEAIEVWNHLKEEHKKARHIPYAYFLEHTAGKSDDKEPTGTSATPIFQTLERNHLVNRAIYVVRYFGGIKLGAGGLIRAYKTAAQGVIESK